MVCINGKDTDAAGKSISEYLAGTQYDMKRIAVAKNGEIIAASEGYVKKDSCKKGIASVRKNAVDAPVIEPEPDKK